MSFYFGKLIEKIDSVYPRVIRGLEVICVQNQMNLGVLVSLEGLGVGRLS